MGTLAVTRETDIGRWRTALTGPRAAVQMPGTASVRIGPKRSHGRAETAFAVEGRNRSWASMEQEPAYVGNHIAQSRGERRVRLSGRHVRASYYEECVAAGSVDSL